jgi:hypothetical protein
MKKLFGRCQKPGIKGQKQWSRIKQKLHSWAQLLKSEIFQQLKQEQTEESGQKQKLWQDQRVKQRHEPRQIEKQLTSPFFSSQRTLQVARTDCAFQDQHGRRKSNSRNRQDRGDRGNRGGSSYVDRSRGSRRN